MKHIKLFALFAVILLAAYLQGCTAPVKESANSAPKFEAPANLRFLVPWVNGKITLQCVIEEIDSAGYKLNNIAFYRDSIKSPYMLFSQHTQNYPIAIFPLKDNSGNLMTIWESGVTYNFRVFNFNGDKVQSVLEGYSQTYPELFYENKTSENLSILITNVDLVKNRRTKEKEMMPVSATLYRWKNDKYMRVPNIPWARRFSSGK
ncbi:MAG TPA: hypothetical protein VHO03_19945 [Ignavibacteriales bacterium]|nr:hypothetical protein [Ignavibacteriales bacterium]